MSQWNLNGWLLLLDSSSSLLSTPKGEQWWCTNSPSEQVVHQQRSRYKNSIGTALFTLYYQIAELTRVI